MKKLLIGLCAAAMVAPVAPAIAQDDDDGSEYVISMYRAAPGKQLDLVSWFVERERVQREAGLPVSQLYVHSDGAGWDYFLIDRRETEADFQAMDAAAERLGIDNGPSVGLRLREVIAEHQDTIVFGPMPASAYLEWVSEDQ